MSFVLVSSQGQKGVNDSSLYDDGVVFSVTGTKVTLPTCLIPALIRWRGDHENWASKADSILQTQRMLDSTVSFVKRDINCSYVITRYGTSERFSFRPEFYSRLSRLLTDYMVWRGVDPLTLWLAYDTIPNADCKPLYEDSEICQGYYEIKEVGTRQYSGWIKDENDQCLPNAYLYGEVMGSCIGSRRVIGRSDSVGRFECNLPNLPMTIVIKDESRKELENLTLEEGKQLDKKIRIRKKKK